jgi:hypothetical protein
MFKKRVQKDKITGLVQPRVLTGGVTASNMPAKRGKVIQKEGGQKGSGRLGMAAAHKLTKSSVAQKQSERRLAIPQKKFNR